MLNFGASKPRVKGGPGPPGPPLDLHLNENMKQSIDSDIDIVSSQLYVCHILVSKKCQLQAGTIHGIGEKSC